LVTSEGEETLFSLERPVDGGSTTGRQVLWKSATGRHVPRPVDGAIVSALSEGRPVDVNVSTGRRCTLDRVDRSMTLLDEFDRSATIPRPVDQRRTAAILHFLIAVSSP
jgi:hypothetical protein